MISEINLKEFPEGKKKPIAGFRFLSDLIQFFLKNNNVCYISKTILPMEIKETNINFQINRTNDEDRLFFFMSIVYITYIFSIFLHTL